MSCGSKVQKSCIFCGRVFIQECYDQHCLKAEYGICISLFSDTCSNACWSLDLMEEDNPDYVRKPSVVIETKTKKQQSKRGPGKGYAFLPSEGTGPVFRLSIEEKQERNIWILGAKAHGLSVKEIAYDVGLTEAHVYNILRAS